MTNANTSTLPLNEPPVNGHPSQSEGRNALNEAELVQQAYQGHQTAWAALMQLHQEPIFRLAYLLLHNSDEAKDIAQETFIRAYQSLDRFDQERPLRPCRQCSGL